MKTKRIVSLLIAFVMLFAISAPVAASTYDAARMSPYYVPPCTVWTLNRHYHWVTRGQTMADIAALWAPITGVDVNEIMWLNEEYFRDLGRRNRTLNLTVDVEPSVRLHVGFSLQARHYVWRGDSLANLSDGTNDRFVRALGGYRPVFSPSIIPAQNENWFLQLDAWNYTSGVARPLIESFAITNVYNQLWIGGADVNTMSAWGSPLLITLPVQVEFTPNPLIGERLHPARLPGFGIYHRAIFFMANDREQVPQVNPFQWSTYHPPLIPASPLAVNPMYASHPVLGAAIGLVQAPLSNFVHTLVAPGTLWYTPFPYWPHAA